MSYATGGITPGTRRFAAGSGATKASRTPKIEGDTALGLHRRVWNLRVEPSQDAAGGGQTGSGRGRRGPGRLVAPGMYTVVLELQTAEGSRVLNGPREVRVVRLREGS